MLKFYTFILLSLLIASPLVHAQFGPAGVGDDNSNRIWFNAATLGLNDDDPVTTFSSTGGNTLSITQTAAGRQPVFESDATNNLNGYPVLSFDGSDDVLEFPDDPDINDYPSTTADAKEDRSYYFVFRANSTSGGRRVIYEEGGNTRGIGVYIQGNRLYVVYYDMSGGSRAGEGWGFKDLRFSINANQVYQLALIMDGNNSSTGTLEVYLDGTLQGSLTDIGLFYRHGAEGGLGGHYDSFRYGGGGGASTSDTYGNHFEGDIAELFFFNNLNNPAQRIIIENHLSAKYDIPLTANDLYTQDDPANGNYDHDVAGIGALSSGNHSDAEGAGLVRMLNPANLDNDEFLLWGNNNADISTANTTDVPPAIAERSARVWAVSETGGDVGATDIRFDLSDWSIKSASDLRMLIDTDGDGNFDDETPISGATSLGGNNFEFAGINLSDGQRFTIGTTVSILATEWLSFELTREEAGIRLDWMTEDERNSSHYLIERSADGVNWEILEAIPAQGNNPSSYRFFDAYPLEGYNYYRLREVEFGGVYSFSDVRSLNWSLDYEWLASPNPTTDALQIQFERPSEVLRWELWDLQGRRLKTEQADGQQTLNISLGDLPKGSYLLRINSNGYWRTQRILKQ